jgi:hypothetical protein
MSRGRRKTIKDWQGQGVRPGQAWAGRLVAEECMEKGLEVEAECARRGLPVVAVARWLKDEWVVERYGGKEVFGDGVDRAMQVLMPKAVEAWRDVLSREGVMDSDRLRAAEGVANRRGYGGVQKHEVAQRVVIEERTAEMLLRVGHRVKQELLQTSRPIVTLEHDDAREKDE